MKRATKVNKTDRGEQDPFSKQLVRERKENARLRQECAEQISAAGRKADEEIDAACVARDGMMACAESAEDRMLLHERVHADFASVAPVLRSKSILRRLWWGIRFGLWGVFGYEVSEMIPNPKFDIGLAQRHLDESFQDQGSAQLSDILQNSKPDHDLKDLAYEAFKGEPE